MLEKNASLGFRIMCLVYRAEIALRTAAFVVCHKKTRLAFLRGDRVRVVKMRGEMIPSAKAHAIMKAFNIDTDELHRIQNLNTAEP